MPWLLVLFLLMPLLVDTDVLVTGTFVGNALDTGILITDAIVAVTLLMVTDVLVTDAVVTNVVQ